jgi:hypothetical protein
MSHEKIRRMAESVGLVGLSPLELEQLSILTLEAQANLVRLPKQRKENEPAHVFFVPQRTSLVAAS